MPRSRLVLVAAVCLVTACSAPESVAAPGASGACSEVETVPIQGGAHLLEGSAPPVPYNSTPPTSGWHSSGSVRIGVRGPSEPLSEPDQVSVLEAGGAVVTYNGLAAQEVAALEEAATRDFPGRVAVTPYDRLGEGEVAFTAWGTLQRCDGLDLDALRAFVSTHADEAAAPPGDH